MSVKDSRTQALINIIHIDTCMYVSVVPINQITIKISRLLEFFLTISIGIFQGCNISLLE